MDPQVISKKFNNKYNGFKVDIFNLGIVLLILRTGKGDFTVNDAKLIFQKKEKKFWNSLESEGNKLDNDFKELVSKMLSYKQENRPKNIDEILNDKWFNSIKEIIKDKEKLSKLEDDIKKELKNRKEKIKNGKKIKKEQKGESSGSLNENVRSIENTYKRIFDLNLEPKYLLSVPQQYNYIIIKGKENFNPADLMNYLYYRVEEEYNDNCTIEKSDKKLMFDIEFNYDINEELETLIKEMNKECNESNNNDNEEDEEEDNIDDDIYQKNMIIQVKLFKSLNEEYLIRIMRKSGELFDFYKKFDKISSFVDNYLGI